MVADSPSIDPSADSTGDDGFSELDCVRHNLSSHVIANAELRAERLAIGADRVLIASGALDEETYLRALGDSIGVPFEPLDGVPRAQCPLDDDRLVEAAATGLLPLNTDDGPVYVVAPRGIAARRILKMVEDAPDAAARFCYLMPRLSARENGRHSRGRSRRR